MSRLRMLITSTSVGLTGPPKPNRCFRKSSNSNNNTYNDDTYTTTTTTNNNNNNDDNNLCFRKYSERLRLGLLSVWASLKYKCLRSV